MVRPMVHSEKHIIPRSLLTIEEQTISRFVIVNSVAVPSGITDVREGSTVKAVYVEIWYLGESSQPCVQISSIEKQSGDMSNMSFTDAGTLNSYDNKKNLLKISQGQVGDSNTNPTPVFREWVAIPKGKQRFGLGDQLVLNVAGVGVVDNGLQVCGTFIYKEYY